jgi:two-component system response regulator
MHILIVDDNPDDVELFRLALLECRGEHQLSVATDGVEALAFLRQEEPFVGAVRPDIVLLDLNMPRKDGREVLAEVKVDENLHTIPFIVLTSSDLPEDVLTVYRLQANCYIQKPVDFNEFIRIAKLVEDFWFGITKLPSDQSLRRSPLVRLRHQSPKSLATGSAGA